MKGTELASLFKVTRQIIVKDIAILRAEGRNIIATPDGYISTQNGRVPFPLPFDGNTNENGSRNTETPRKTR